MKRYAVIFFILATAVTGAYSQQGLRLAVMDLKSDGVSLQTAKTVTNMLRSELVNMQKFIVVERGQVNEILKEQGFQQTGCTDQSCAVQIGKLVSARKILVGEVSPMGNAIVVTVRIVDVEQGVSEFAATEKAITEEVIDVTVKNLAAKLAGNIEKSKDYAAIQPEKKPLAFDVSFKGKFLYPFGKLADIASKGYGVLANISISKYGFIFGIESGYYAFEGANSNVDSFTSVPMALRMEYKINIINSFAVLPTMTFGMNYNKLSYSTLSSPEAKKNKTALEPAATAGLNLRFSFTDYLYIDACAEYFTIFESGGMMNSVSFCAGFGFIF